MTREEWQLRPREALWLLGMGAPVGLQFSITAIGTIIL